MSNLSPLSLDVVIPVYNEEETLPVLFKTLDTVFSEANLEHAGLSQVNYIFIDDGSKDNSANIIHKEISRGLPATLCRFSRNFGHQNAVSAGIDISRADLSHTAIEKGLKTKGNKYYYDITERKPEMVGQYDSVFLFDVIEHLAETQSFIKASIEHIKPGGLLFINVPALSLLFSKYDTALGHIRRYSKTTLKQEFIGSGVEIVEVRYWGLTLIPLLFLRKIMLALSFSGKSIVRTGFEPPSRLVETILFAMMRFELKYIRRPLLGSSLLLIARRKV